MKTRITELLGIEHPIIQGGMHFVGFAELAGPLTKTAPPGNKTAVKTQNPRQKEKRN